MPICHHFAPNGEKSILYQQLEEKYGADKAHDIWTAIRTQQFLNKEGDWMHHRIENIGMDVNGEPGIEYVERALHRTFGTNIPHTTFKPANKEQSDAISGIQNFIQKGNPDQYFTVAGKAGTGKTTIVQEAIAPFVEQGKNVLVAALSHKAKLVLADKLEARFGQGPIISKSIAGALAMGMDMESGKFSTEFGNEYVVPPVAKADIIIIDEASMVNEEALDLIMSKKKAGAKVIFLGDIGQLPPIREKGDPKEGKPSPVFGTKTDNTAKLTERVRQGEESPILPYADLFWDNSQAKNPVVNPAAVNNRKDIVNDKGALVFADTVNSILPKVLPLYKEGIENNNPNLVKIVLYRNDPRRMVNRAVREYVFENQAKQQFLSKELIIFTDNHSVDGLVDPISNSTEVQVQSANQRTTSDGLKVWDLEFGYEGKPVMVTTLDDSSKPAHEKLVSDLFSKAKALPKGQERNKALKTAWSEKKKYAPLDYSYAITSHKSQGSTYNTVVVVENDIMNVGPIGPKEKSQSIYTALTRASTTTIVVDGQKTNQDNLDKALALSHSKMTAPVVVPETTQPVTEVPSQEITGTKTEPTIEVPKTYKETITSLPENGIFVFGSNTQGRHGKGAALEAKTKFGAKYGQAEGPQGKSYAIITKDLTKANHPSRTSVEIKEQINGLYRYANQHPELDFYVAYKADGQNLNAYSSKEMASFFGNNSPSNIVFEEGFRKLVDTNATIDQWQAQFPKNAFGEDAMKVPTPPSTPLTQKLDTAKMKVVPVTLEPVGEKKARSNNTRDSEEVMMGKIAKIYNDAIANPNNLYRLDYKFTSHKYRFTSGYTARELADMFDQQGIPANVQFDPSFYKLIQNSSKRITEEFAIQQPAFINRNEKAIKADVARILVPKISDNGQVQGFFTPAEHKDIVDSIVYGISTLWSKDQAKGSKALILFFDGLNNSRLRMQQTGNNLDLAQILGFIHNSRVRLADEAIRQLGNYGWTIEDKDRAKVLKSLENFADLGELEKQVTLSDGTIANVQATLDGNGDIIEQSGHGLQDYGDSTFELDPKDTASGRMKMFIATLPEVDRQLQSIKNFFGMKKLVDFEQTFEDTLNILADHPTNKFEDMISNLQQSGKPNLVNLANELMKQDQQMQNEFVKVMSKQYQQFTMILFDRVKDNRGGADTFSIRVMNANRYSQQKTIINNWKEQQKLSEIMVINAAGQRSIDIKRVQEKWVPWLDSINQTDWRSEQAITSAKKYMKGVFNVSGIEMSDPMMNYLFNNIEKLTKGTGFAGGIAKQFSITKTTGKPEGLFSAFILKFAGKTNIHDVVDDEQAVKLAEQNNPLHTEGTAMNILAKVAAMFTPKLYSATHKSSEGKNVWDYGQNTKLSLKLKSMLNDFAAFKGLMDQTDIAKNNWYLDYFQNNPKALNSIALEYLDGTKPSWGKRGTTRQDMSDREQALTSIALFQNEARGFNKDSKVNFISLTHSDKTTTPVFTGVPKVSLDHPRLFGFNQKGEVIKNKIIGSINSPLYNVFKSEWNRVTNETKDYNNNQYNVGRKLFYFIPEFNYDAMQKMVSDGTLTQKEMNLLWVNGERDFTRSVNNDRELNVINKVLTLVTQRRVQNTLDTWKKMGIVRDDGTMMFDKKYVKKLMSEFDIAKREDIIQAAAQDYSINYFLFNTAMSQLFYGDPAIAWKGKPGQSDMSQVASTMKEYAKRLAKDIAPGQDPNWGTNKSYNTITLADVKPSEDYMYNVSQRLGDAYKAVEGTDAQEITTTQEHLDVAYAMGLVPMKEYNEMSEIIRKAKGGYYEFTSPEHLKVIMQPMKPVYSGTRHDVQNGALLEDYVKSSSFPLYPPLTAGTEMEHLRTLMEKGNIQRANYVSAKKLGIPTNPVQMFDKAGRFTNPSKESIAASQQQLSRDGFRIQQEVPYDEEKEAIKIVSQMNKLIVEGIAHIEGFKVGDKTLNGKELRALKENIRSQMISKNLKEFFDKLNVKTRDGFYSMPTKDKVYDILAEEARKKGYTLNELQGLLTRDENGDLAIPLMFNTAADRFESLLMSMVKKVAEVKMPGKSYVQAASIGLQSVTNREQFRKMGDLTQEQKRRIVYADGYNGEALKTLRIEDGIVKSAQVLAPFNFFDNDGNKLSVEDFLIPGTRTLDHSKIPKELLQLVGARIPNQGHNSMLPIEIVGFIPDNLGDLIVVPSAITKQMGADFDVDKLYTYKRPYFVNDEGGLETYPHTEGGGTTTSEEQRLGANKEEWEELKVGTRALLGTNEEVDKKIFNKALGEVVKQRYPDGNVPTHTVTKTKTTEEHSTKEGLQTQYFDVHWSVLTHPYMIEKVLNPLDKPDLADENKILAPAEGVMDYYDVNSQLKDFQSGKDAKTLVGSTSLSVTFNSVIQDKDLYLYHLDEEGKEVRDYVTVLDEDGKELKLTNLSGYGTSTYNGEVRTKHDNLTTMQSAAVDNAKERTLDNLNLTTNTYRAAAAFVQLETEDGKAVNLKYVTRLLTQPIIREYDALMKSGNDSLSEEFQKDLRSAVIKQLEDKYNKEDDADVMFDADSLLKAGRTGTSQLTALKLFVQLDAIGQRLTELQSLANGDTNGAGPNLLSSLDKEEKMRTINQEPIANAGSIFDGTEQDSIFSATTITANRILTKLLPYEKLKPITDQIRVLAGKDRLTIDQQRNIIRSMRSFVYTSGNHWWTNAQADRVRLLYNTGDNKSLAQRLMEAKRTWGKDNYFLQRLNPVIGNTLTSPDYIQYQAATVGIIDEEMNHEAWTSLLVPNEGENAEAQRQLGEDLLRYTFLTGGVQDANSFVKFVPVSYLANTAFGEMLKARETALREHGEDANEQDTTYESFAKQFIQHNPEIATQVDQSVFGTLDAGQDYKESFKVDTSGETATPALLRAADGTLVPFFSYRSKVEGNTYKLYQKQVIGDSVYYTRIDTLGNQYTDEYDGRQDTSFRSIFTENRSLAERIPGIDMTNQSINLENNSLSNYHNKENYFEQIGAKEGSNFEDILGTIESSKDLPEYQRTVAKILSTTNNEAITSISDKLLFAEDRKTGVHFINESGTRGAYSNSRGLELNGNEVRNRQEAAETVLHELTHERLQSVIAAFGFDQRIFDQLQNFPEGERKSILDQISNLGSTHPDVVKHLEDLDRIRYEAFNSLQNSLSKDSKILNYAFGTLQEFVAHVMSGDELVVNYLNNVQSSRGETLLDRIWNLFSELLESLARSLGIHVKEGSLLKEALAHTLKLSAYNVSSEVNITNAVTMGTTLVVPSEAEANELKSLLKDTYEKGVQLSTNGINYSINLTNNKLAQSTAPSTQVGRVIEKLSKQLEDAGYALDKGTKEQRIAAKIRYHELNDDINALKREDNIDLIAEIGKKQLAWVDKILNTPHPLAVDVLNAKNVTDMWSNLIELLYDGTTESTDPRFGEIAEQGIKKRMKLMQKKAQEVVGDALGNRLTLTGLDYKDKIEDIGFATANFLTLSRVKPKLVQGIATLGRQAANNRDEEIGRVRDRLMSLEARMKKIGIRPEHFIQDEQWGLVSRLSGSWYTHLSTLRKNLESKVEDIDKREKDEKVRGTKKSEAYNKYWNEIKKSAVFVDLREFFDTTKDTVVPKTDTTKAMKKLSDAVGSEEYARELLEKATEKYQEYVDERTTAKEMIYDQEGLTDEQKDDEYMKWKHHNSPVDFLHKMTQKQDAKYVNSGSKWITMVPKKESTEFYDKKYKDIYEKGGETQAVYEQYKTLLNEMKSYLPLTEQQKLQEDFLPIVSKDTILSLSSMIGVIKNWDNAVMNSLTATEQEEMWRLKGDHLPVLYTRTSKKTEDPEQRSTDLIRLMEVFSMMALHHKHLGQVVDAINVAQEILKDVNRQKVDNDEKGIKNTLDSVKYFVDKLIYKKPIELEGKLDVPVYSANPVKQYQITKEVTELTKQKNLIQQEIDEKNDEGIFQTEELDAKKKAVEDRLEEIGKDARFLYASKGVDTMIQLNQLKALSYNPFSAVSNFTFGLISVSIHANSRTDYDGKSMRWAYKTMMNATKKYYSFGTINNGTAVKIQALMDRVGMMGDIVDTQYGKSNLHTRKDSPVVDAIKPYNWQKSGDYFAKGAMMLAMMKFKEVELSDGTKASLWDALDEHGLWNEEKYGQRPEWYSDDISSQTEWNSFRDKIRKVGILVFGNQDKNAPLMGKKHALVRLMGQFRMSWFAEGIATRFASERDDVELGRKTKGRWRTYGDLGFGTSGMVLIKQLLSSLPGIKVDAFKGTTYSKGENAGKPISELDIENMRKNFAGIAWTMAMTAAVLMIKGIAFDDDRKKGKKRTAQDAQWQLLLNMVIRNHQDLMMYSSPSVFDTVTGNIMPATAVLTDAWKALKASGTYLSNPDDKDAFEKWAKKQARAIPFANLWPKTEYMTRRSLDAISR